MAHLVPLADPADPRAADFVRLRDVQLRKSLEAEHGLFIAEGEKVIRRAVETGHPVRSFLMAERWISSLADVLDGVDAPVYVVDDATAEAVTGYPVHRGALASMGRRPLPAVSELVTSARRVVVLEDLVDHGNVGAIFRCAAALGVPAVILSPRCADPLYRRSVKVSMGAVFAVPYARMTDWHHGLAELRAAGFRLLALTPDQSAVPVDKAMDKADEAMDEAMDRRAGQVTGTGPMGDRVALMLGAEGDGLSSRWLREADEAVCIPMSPDAQALGVDSLNVVAAAAIACHSLTR